MPGRTLSKLAFVFLAVAALASGAAAEEPGLGGLEVAPSTPGPDEGASVPAVAAASAPSQPSQPPTDGVTATATVTGPAGKEESLGTSVAGLEAGVAAVERSVGAPLETLLGAMASVDRGLAALVARPDVAPARAASLCGAVRTLRASVSAHAAASSVATTRVLSATRAVRRALVGLMPATRAPRRSGLGGAVVDVVGAALDAAGRGAADVAAAGQEALSGQAAEALRTLLQLPDRDDGAPSTGPRPVGSPFVFPRDAGAHAALVEWWYYNGHFGRDGATCGFELCFFKAVDGVFVCHVAVTDESNRAFHYQRFFCLPFDGAAAHGDLDVRARMRDLVGGHDLSCWARRRTGAGTSVHDQTVHGEVGPFRFTFDLAAGGRQPLVVNGDGIIDMPEGGDSWYYSLTRLALRGTLERTGADGRSERLDVTGQAWMDHQWGMFYTLRRGWDWYSFQMEDGTDYNLFAMRKIEKGSFRYGSPSADTYASRMDAGGRQSSTASAPSTAPAVEVRPLALYRGKTGTFATAWEVGVPSWGEAFLVRARLGDQEVATRPPDPLPTYWEGSCDVVRRNADGTFTRGLAYVEHMPYDPGLAPGTPRVSWPEQSSTSAPDAEPTTSFLAAR